MRKAVAVLVAALVVGVLAAPAGAAPGGNAAAAQRCHKGGYLGLHRLDGSGFRNVGDCVAYAAKGGQFQEDQDEPPGGTFEVRLTNLETGDTTNFPGTFLADVVVTNATPGGAVNLQVHGVEAIYFEDDVAVSDLPVVDLELSCDDQFFVSARDLATDVLDTFELTPTAAVCPNLEAV